MGKFVTLFNKTKMTPTRKKALLERFRKGKEAAKLRRTTKITIIKEEIIPSPTANGIDNSENKIKEKILDVVAVENLVDKHGNDKWKFNSILEKENPVEQPKGIQAKIQKEIQEKPEEKPEIVRLEQDIISGNRIVNLQHYTTSLIKTYLNHLQTCKSSKIRIQSEKRLGLGSQVIFACVTCKKGFNISTLNPIEKEGDFHIMLLRAAWGTVTTGFTYTPIRDFLATLNIPYICSKPLDKAEHFLSERWEQSLKKSLLEAGKEEKRLAIEQGNVDENGIPFCTVYCDGGWSHRKYGHSYNANSGVAVIIGSKSKKILYIGVRNRFCSVCSKKKRAGVNNFPHECFKNWNGSSYAMEPDIIVKGFKQSISMHGLKFSKMVADGDSCTFAKIQAEVPYKVNKIECRNHAMKNFGKALYKLRTGKTVCAAGKKLLTPLRIKSLQNVATKMLLLNKNGNVQQLIDDFSYVIEHSFADHSSCLSRFCETVGEVEKSTLHLVHETDLYVHIDKALDKLRRVAENLIAAEHTNPAENYMSILCKLNAGKRLNLTGRGAFQTRAYVAALKYNLGPKWQSIMWRDIFVSEPGEHFEKRCDESYARHFQRVQRRAQLKITALEKQKSFLINDSES